MNAEQENSADAVTFDWQTLREAYRSRSSSTPTPAQAINTLTVISAELKELPFRLDDLIEEITKSVDGGDLAKVCTTLVQVRMEIARQAWATGGLAKILAAATMEKTEKTGEDT